MEEVQRIYDLAMTHKLDADDLFIHRIQQFCAEARLNFFLIEPLWVAAFYEALKSGQVHVRVLLNMHSEHHDPSDIFHQLVRTASDKGSHVIDALDRAIAAFDKARLHTRLIEAGLNVPYTVMVPGSDAEKFRLDDKQREALGSPFVVKPSMGYGRKGVVLDAVDEAAIARSSTQWKDPCYLLQQRIVPKRLDCGPAYFRVFYVFDAVYYCWWNCFTDQYRALNPLEKQLYGLKPLEDIMRQVAQVTGMTFFSSEIAQAESGDFVLIDYVNDQCHMLSQSSDPRIGAPDQLITNIARRLVWGAKRLVAPKA